MTIFNNNTPTVFIRSVLAGICIGLGGAIFLKLGGIIGAAMFAFGLLTVVHFKLPLYTGTAGFINLKSTAEWVNMFIIWFGNILGCCFLAALLSNTDINGAMVISNRISAGLYQDLLMGIGCGLIMTLIVQGGRDGNLLLILFGIPLFILLGFYHSIADAFYVFTVPDATIANRFILPYIVIGIGNFIGCNIPRLLQYKNK